MVLPALTIALISCPVPNSGASGGYTNNSGTDGGTNQGGTDGNTENTGSSVKVPPAPQDAWVSGWSGTSIKVTWYVVIGADKYKIQYSTSVTGPFQSIETTALTQLVIDGLQPNTRYYVRVSAINSAGEGPYRAAFGSTNYGY